MTYLVTGGGGFVGSHLIERLLEENHSVICLDNFSTGKRKNLESLNNNRLTIIEGDICDKNIVQKVIKDVKYVFHLAAQISVNHSVHDPLFDSKTNIEGMIQLLEASCQSSVKRFVYISTGGAIYGDPTDLPASESTAEKPISPYGLSKLTGEKYLQWYHNTYGLSFSIVRPANIYGPRQDPLGEAGVISIFLGNIKNRKPLHIFGDGTDTRDYIFVKDVIDICLKSMQSSSIDIFNAGTGKQTSLLDLIEIVEKVTKITLKKIFEKPRPGDVKHISLDISKAKKFLNWYPKTDLETGIKETWNWFNSQN